MTNIDKFISMMPSYLVNHKDELEILVSNKEYESIKDQLVDDCYNGFKVINKGIIPKKIITVQQKYHK